MHWLEDIVGDLWDYTLLLIVFLLICIVAICLIAYRYAKDMDDDTY